MRRIVAWSAQEELVGMRVLATVNRPEEVMRFAPTDSTQPLAWRQIKKPRPCSGNAARRIMERMWPEPEQTEQLLRDARQGDLAAASRLLQRHRQAQLGRAGPERLDPGH